MDRSAAAERLRELAREAGFELYGIATLAPASTGGAYERWLARGDHAGMAWMERNQALRIDPRGLLEGARSALVVGLRYAPLAGDDPPSDDSIWPLVARYARGRDYHLVLRERLERVARALIAERPEAKTRICVDTAPLLERELAARAGLGAVGKNTNLLNPRFGSWFLLGELLTTLDLAPDSPLADLCGDCHLCLDACPTGALPAPYRLDARRCLSYATIEHRGAIDEPLRPHLAERLFGCDICQEVCPWNSRSMAEAEEPDLRAEGPRRELDLGGLLGMTPTAYLEAFRHSAMSRARRDGLRRNAAYALAGETGQAAAAALVEAAADAESPVVQAAARWALERRDGKVGETRD